MLIDVDVCCCCCCCYRCVVTDIWMILNYLSYLWCWCRITWNLVPNRKLSACVCTLTIIRLWLVNPCFSARRHCSCFTTMLCTRNLTRSRLVVDRDYRSGSELSHSNRRCSTRVCQIAGSSVSQNSSSFNTSLLGKDVVPQV